MVTDNLVKAGPMLHRIGSAGTCKQYLKTNQCVSTQQRRVIPVEVSLVGDACKASAICAGSSLEEWRAFIYPVSSMNVALGLSSA